MSKKIKLLYYSDFSLAKTGFGRICHSLLKYLYLTGKYEIINAAMMMPDNSPDLDATPWKSVGTIPSDEHFMKAYQSDDKIKTIAGYGFYKIDEIVKRERPDCILAVQDIWGIALLTQKPYWNKIPCIFWTTLDSLPILDRAIEASQKCQPGNFWVWSNFAEKAMKADGFTNVQTVHAPVDSNEFRRLEKVKRLALRTKYKIPHNAFICGEIARNQLRKSLYCLLEGYALFKKDNIGVDSSLLIHTCFSEGWNIAKLAKEYGVPKKEILTTYICHQCSEYEVKAFVGEKQNCPYCSSEGSQYTTSPRKGVSEAQLNEIYNLMDVFCHPFSAGGLEIPLAVESKMCEIPTLCTGYSCGEEICEDKIGNLPLDFSLYRDLSQNEFYRAATSSKSVSKQLSRVYRMSEDERRAMGRGGRNWAFERFSIERAASKIDNLLRSQSFTNYDFTFQETKPNPDAVIRDIEDDAEWLIEMYKNILSMTVDKDDKGVKDWLEKLKNK